MTEMTYRLANGGAPVVLDFGEYRSIKYMIVSRHEYPCSYIELGKEYEGISCHGGVTYSGRGVPGFEDVTRSTHWIGWDYAHFGDYIAFMPGHGGKRWSTEELVKEVHEVIDRVKEAEDDDA